MFFPRNYWRFPFLFCWGLPGIFFPFWLSWTKGKKDEQEYCPLLLFVAIYFLCIQKIIWSNNNFMLWAVCIDVIIYKQISHSYYWFWAEEVLSYSEILNRNKCLSFWCGRSATKRNVIIRKAWQGLSLLTKLVLKVHFMLHQFLGGYHSTINIPLCDKQSWP